MNTIDGFISFLDVMTNLYLQTIHSIFIFAWYIAVLRVIL